MLAPGASAQAQSASPAAVPPLNILLPNYESVPVGEVAGLEAGAYLVRANDSSALFYNPAGLPRAERSSISGTAGVFQFDTVTPSTLANSSSSFQQVPAMFGLVLKDVLGHEGWAAGLSLARINSWSQDVTAERSFTVPGGTNRLSYTSASSMDGWMASIGFGAKVTEKFRLGGSLDGQLTMIEKRQRLGDQWNTGAALSTVLVDTDGWGWDSHVRLTMGGQYDLTPSVQFGAALRTSGFGLISDGTSTLEGVARTGSATTAASFFDDEQDVEYRIPFELKAGAAYTFGRGAVEVNVISHSGAGVYAAATSTAKTTVLTDSGTGTVTMQQFDAPPRTVDSRAVVNFAIGGHYNLAADGKWVLHGGYGTDRSPVGDADTEFTKVDLQKVTLGLSIRTKRFLGSLGMQHLSGSSAPMLLRQLQSGQQVFTSFDVASVGFVYSLALLF
jgi:hypothetical protein